MEKKILVAVDGSVYTTNTLHYLEQLFADQSDISLHLLCIVPCSVAPEAREWLDDLELMTSLSPEARRRFAAATRHMKDAVHRLNRHGIKEGQVTTEVRLSRRNVTADIIGVAREGLYDAVVVGRRGVSKLEEMIMGSTSCTMMEKCRDIPLWVIDGKVDSRRFLVPVDGSEHTLKAVEHLCFLLKGNPHAEITLFHSTAMLAQRQVLSEDECYHLLPGEWCSGHLQDTDIQFEAPEKLLLENGFSADKINRLQTWKGLYPSRQIVRQAMIDDYGTIVMGRRGKNVKKGLMGSVCEKVVAMSVDTAIWIVG